MPNTYDHNENDDQMWICQVCDMIVDGDFHCIRCGSEPPWGCDYGQHEVDDELEFNEFDPTDIP